jgi:hypothetical protein
MICGIRVSSRWDRARWLGDPRRTFHTLENRRAAGAQLIVGQSEDRGDLRGVRARGQHAEDRPVLHLELLADRREHPGRDRKPAPLAAGEGVDQVAELEAQGVLAEDGVGACHEGRQPQALVRVGGEDQDARRVRRRHQRAGQRQSVAIRQVVVDDRDIGQEALR